MSSDDFSSRDIIQEYKNQTDMYFRVNTTQPQIVVVKDKEQTAYNRQLLILFACLLSAVVLLKLFSPPQPPQKLNRCIGQTYSIIVVSGHVRSGPGMTFAETDLYVQKGENYQILDAVVSKSQTGYDIDWFKINVNGATGWVSSKFFSIDGKLGGTLNGIIQQ